jgi:pimeloyl-ACP methyl ester carboxylesterase
VLYLVSGIALLLLVGVIYERATLSLDVRRNPPLGKLVDVGGHRLHLYVRGDQGPTVVMDHGLGSLGLTWELVAPAVAKFARVVVYDRAGYGWSDPGPLPRTSDRAAEELHTLLHKAEIPGPYILVGHSLGGLNMRLFASRFPDEVVGMVLVDAMHEDEMTARFPPEHIKGQRLLPKMVRILRVMGQIGLLRLLVKCNMLPGLSSLAKHFPSATAKLLSMLAIRPNALVATYREAMAMEADCALARGGGTLGDKPLVVLAHGLPGPVAPGTSPEVAQRIEHLLREVASDMTRLSANGRLVIAANSGHEIQVYQPDVVIEAISQVVAEVRYER